MSWAGLSLSQSLGRDPKFLSLLSLPGPDTRSPSGDSAPVLKGLTLRMLSPTKQKFHQIIFLDLRIYSWAVPCSSSSGTIRVAPISSRSPLPRPRHFVYLYIFLVTPHPGEVGVIILVL